MVIWLSAPSIFSCARSSSDARRWVNEPSMFRVIVAKSPGGPAKVPPAVWLRKTVSGWNADVELVPTSGSGAVTAIWFVTRITRSVKCFTFVDI